MRAEHTGSDHLLRCRKPGSHPDLIVQRPEKQRQFKMSVLRFLRNLLIALRAASHAAAAVDQHRQPARQDLDVLGISPRSFRQIHI